MLRDRLRIEIFDTREEAGRVAVGDIAEAIKELLFLKDEINIILEASPSQSDCHMALLEDKSIDWPRINAFHTVEYIGLDKNAPQGLGNRLRGTIFDKVPFKSVELINPSEQNTEAGCRQYTICSPTELTRPAPQARLERTQPRRSISTRTAPRCLITDKATLG